MSEFQNITPVEIDFYSDAHTSDVASVLDELDRETHLKFVNGRMLSGKSQGQFLSFICQMLKPQNVLEIGTFTGYSAISMALSMPEGSKLTAIEANPEYEDIIRKYIEKSGMQSRIDLHIADAKTLIPLLNNEFQLVFLDADKVNYPLYYDLILPKLSQGGILIADNVLWSGQILDETSKNKEIIALRNFNDKVRDDSRVSNLLLPIRDGLMLIRKN